MSFKKATAALVISGAAVVGLASPAFAHECFNPNKPAGAGANYTITGFGPDGPTFEQTGKGQGMGGFATLNLSLFGGPDVDVDVHTVGQSPRGIVGPGERKPELACDGKGIDYLEACFAG